MEKLLEKFENDKKNLEYQFSLNKEELLKLIQEESNGTKIQDTFCSYIRYKTKLSQVEQSIEMVKKQMEVQK